MAFSVSSGPLFEEEEEEEEEEDIVTTEEETGERERRYDEEEEKKVFSFFCSRGKAARVFCPFFFFLSTLPHPFLRALFILRQRRFGHKNERVSFNKKKR